MTWFDYAVLIVIGISVLVSIIHGFVRELLALAAWIVAFLAAQWAAPLAITWMPAALEDPSLRALAPFVLVFVAVLIVMTLLAYAIAGLVKTAGLGGVDPAAGSDIRIGARRPHRAGGRSGRRAYYVAQGAGVALCASKPAV
jgi:membrane protein required for colicin V production